MKLCDKFDVYESFYLFWVSFGAWHSARRWLWDDSLIESSHNSKHEITHSHNCLFSDVWVKIVKTDIYDGKCFLKIGFKLLRTGYCEFPHGMDGCTFFIKKSILYLQSRSVSDTFFIVLFIITLIGSQSKFIFLSLLLIAQTLLRTGTFDGKFNYFVENGFKLSFDGVSQIIEISEATFSDFEIICIEKYF
jgi:hypothetical protein